MTAHDDLDRQLNDFLRGGPAELPYQSFDVVRDRMERTGQRVVIGPWRLPEMNKIVTIGLAAAAAVVLAVVVGIQFIGTPSGGTGGPGSEPTATPDRTSAPGPSSSEAAAPPPLTQSFSSTRHGISLSYPEGWTAHAATEPWTTSAFPLSFEGTNVDVLYDPDLESGGPFLIFASQPLVERYTSPHDWVVEQMASEEGCGASARPYTVDESTGLIGGIGCDIAVFTASDRGYWIQLYTGGEAPLTYDRVWFEAVLATVQFAPEEAVD